MGEVCLDCIGALRIDFTTSMWNRIDPSGPIFGEQN